MVQQTIPTWPVLTQYEQDQLTCVALPLGGIGTGSVALGGRGNLCQWEVMNRPSHHFIPLNTFFALYTRTASGKSCTKVLEGRLQPPYGGPHGTPTPNAGLPRFRFCQFEAAYPFGQVLLSDPHMPVNVRLQAFNPFIPTDAEKSGLPVAMLRFVLTNASDEVVTSAICGNMQNFVGWDGVAGAPQQNRNDYRRGKSIQGIYFFSRGVHPLAEQFGSLALTTTASEGVSYRTAWAKLGWNDTLLDFWDDFSTDGQLDEREPSGVEDPQGSLAIRLDIPPHEERAITFLLTWHFPNRQTWTPHIPAENDKESRNANHIGNYYTTLSQDAWDVAVRTAEQLPVLEAKTVTFVRTFCESSLPTVVKEAALYNLSALRSQTTFRTEDGYLFGWEGCNDTSGSCYGSCTHVWNYEQATAFLFGKLAQGMREVEFLHGTNDAGLMSFRINLPLDHATEHGLAAADGQMGCIMKLYRDWQLSGDHSWLQKLWPKARQALEFCWQPGGWDADQDGVMEGCQHNTMDVEYYGPNPQMGLWYLGALRAAEEMAYSLKELEFARRCHKLYSQGSQWIDTHLYNGEYYEQKVHPPLNEESIAPGLRLGTGAHNLAHPEYQLGAGCLIDQLVGQWMAHICNLGYLVEPSHVRTTLSSIMRYNFQKSLAQHPNHMRTYALNDEAAFLMCSYPHGERPQQPFPYYSEVMTGFEHTVCTHMLYEGFSEEGIRGITAVRARYTGGNRNPFDEAECGSYYARSMASWAAVLALSGFHYSALNGGAVYFGQPQRDATYFWSNGYAWGNCTLHPTEKEVEVVLNVLYGEITFQRLILTDFGEGKGPETGMLKQGESIVLQVARN
ncbi:hypothetical protein KDA_50910 [Dictyobacter alpinus]|uniref:Glycosyl-hydrolase family 116 catalytic region domain-containing protein n=1 Tax=Dictyobacter alpinus TaxID=2014873 RepID=A0A402BEC7_9CHLR|nr:GH116 family glycosyl-hydrolase [Dictyobacter alpinus]GCE29607.1 hypothetical protein KDA_50910 [Dictyobacter alpinus]